MPADVDTWVLDLDNTLYPPSNGLTDQMNVRIREYLSQHFGTDEAGARRIQSELVATHGTTLRGLMTAEGIEAADYLAFEHRIDGSAYHAEQALPRLGLTDHFDGVFDILAGQGWGWRKSSSAASPRPAPRSTR